MASNLVWRGDALKARLARASKESINELAQEATAEARRSVPVRSGKLKQSIRPVKAQRTGKGFAGGVKVAWYGLLGKNRRKLKRIERDAQSKLTERIATKFRRGV